MPKMGNAGVGEVAERLIELLRRAEELFSSSLALREYFEGVCALVVPALADSCEISLFRDGRLVSEATKRIDAATEKPATDSAVEVPLTVLDRAIGVLSLANGRARPPLSATDLAIASAIAQRTAAAVEMARLVDSERQARQLAESALARRAEAEARLTAIAEHSNALIYVVDLDGHFIFVNHAYERTFGLDHLVGRSMFDVFPEHVARLFAEEDRKVVESGEPMQFEEDVPQGDGLHTYVTMLFPLRDGAGAIVAVGGISTDVTQRKRLDQALRQAQEAELVGRLAGGIAHEYNNLLTTIAGNGRLVLADLPADHPGRERVDRMLRSTDRAATLTHRLLVLARRQVRQIASVNPSELIAELEPAIRPIIGSTIRLELSLAAGVPPVSCDPNELKELILSLVHNACDAMPSGGSLRIATSFSDERVRIEVADSGSGMSDEARARMFEPFFTTKAPGEGVGLGLSTVLAVVEECGGRIDVTSAPNAGTRVCIELPPARVRPSPRQAAVAVSHPASPSKTVLIVEDEEEVREVLQAVVEAVGYRVVTAGDGVEALELLRTVGAEIALMLSDVVMPRLSGLDLAQKVRAEWPQIRIILMSGYPGETLHRLGSLDAVECFLNKPFEMDALVTRIAALIGSVASSA